MSRQPARASAQHVARWTRTFALLVVLVPLLPGTAHAIQLKWSSGATDLSFASDTLCRLVVQADSAEVTLPGSWRLQWVADSSGIQFSALDPTLACLADTAKVDSIAPPSTPADSTANQVTAYFCSAGSSLASTAYFLVDLVGGSKGRLRVVALNPADTTQVIESNEVKLNGGIDGDYGPAILSASRTHQGDQYLAAATGVGLSQLTAVTVGSPGGAWQAPLLIVQQTETTLLATATIAAPLPSAVIQVSSVSGSSVSAPLAPDALLPPYGPPPFPSYIDASGYIRPKDFAFFYGGLGHFHLFYTRHNTKLSVCGPQADQNARKFTHVSGDLSLWSSQDTSFAVSASGWDSQHVWAPTIVQNGNTYFMFYTGVNANDDQSIGFVTTQNINTNPIVWSSVRTQVFTVESTSNHWALQTHPQQCRDPFVTQDPTDPRRWLMYYTANVAADSTWETVGVARSAPYSLTSWTDIGPLYMVDRHNNYSLKAESPHMFAHLNSNNTTSWWVFFTSDFAVMADRSASSPMDTTERYSNAHWDLINHRLYEHLTNHDPRVQFWNGSEYLKVFRWEYLAGFNAAVVDPCGTVVNPDSNGIWIRRLQWTPGVSSPDAFGLSPGVTAVEDAAHRDERRLGLSLTELRPGTGRAFLTAELPAQMKAGLVVYDLLGRRVKNLARGEIPVGRTVFCWDGHDERGNIARNGVYFARLTSGVGERVVRIPLLR